MPAQQPAIALRVTFALMLFCFTSINAIRLVLSLFALDLGATPLAVSLLYATFYLFPVALSWPIGSYSDRVGSRSLLMVGTVSGAIGCLIPYLWRDLSALYVGALVVGFSFSFYLVLLQNAIGLLSRPDERARNFSNASMVGATTAFIGPLLAGVAIDHVGSAAACLLVAILPSMAVLLLARWGRSLPESTRHAAAADAPTSARPAMVRALVTSALVQLGQDIYQLYLPIYSHDIGLSGSAIGALLACFATAAFVSRLLMPRLIRAIGEEALLSYSLYVAALAFVLLPLFRNAMMLGVVSFVVGLGMGCGQPITTMLIFAHSPGGRSGSTLGLRQTVNNVMRMSGPAVFGFVTSALGLLAVFWVNAALMSVGGWMARRAGADEASQRADKGT